MSGLAKPLEAAMLDELFVELVREARTHRFRVAPNPCVGAAILAGGRVVARGYHRAWGAAHAEIDALEQAARSDIPRDRWDTLVVTLEPCCSHGKTGPCTDAIIAAGLPTVIVGSLDPDSRNKGKGLETLRRAGIEVLIHEGGAFLEDVAPHFLRWTAHERLRRPHPWTIAKWAQTLTGQLSPPADVGDGRWISGAPAREEVQRLRSRVDAIVTGVGTVLADDPRLSLRGTNVKDNPPARVVLDGYLRTSPDARLFAPNTAEDTAGPVHILCLPGSDGNRQRALVEAGASIHGLRGADRLHLVLRDVWSWLWDQGFQRVLLETGPTLLQSSLEEGFVDQIFLVSSGVRGGRGPSLGSWMASAKLLERADRESGEDSLLEAFLAPV